MNNGNKIDNLVYSLITKELEESIRPYLYRHECFKIIENIKIPKSKILPIIEIQMREYGFTDRYIELLTRDLSKRLRFNRRDSREIMNRLHKKHMIKFERNNVYICNGND